MNPIKPLLFLTTRSLVNGVKRALTTPRRLISLLIAVGYYFMFFIRPAFQGQSRGFTPPNLPSQMEFPPLQTISAAIFGLFALLTLFMMLGLTTQSGGFRPPDVDVLFATPISPRYVLLFRMVRDYLIALIFPFFIILLSIKPAKMGWEAVFRNAPHTGYSNLALRGITFTWILLSLCWVCIGYAVSLFIHRSDNQSDKNRKVLGWAMVGFFASLALYIAINVNNLNTPAEIVTLADHLFLKISFFSATLGTWFASAPLTGNWLLGLIGFAGIVGVISLALSIALSQASWMYDQAAVKGFGATKSREMQRAGDVMGIVAERARSGKVKVSTGRWIHRVKMNGPWALLWKEILIQRRSTFGMSLMLIALGVFMSVIPALFPTQKSDMPGVVMLAMQGAVLFMITSSMAQVGFTEVLRRVDLQKPMPFRPSTIVFSEVSSKSVVGIVGVVIGSIIAMCLRPALWQYSIAAIIISPFMSMLLSGVAFLAVMLFPDVDDPSQRQFRGLITLLGTVIFAAFPVGLIAGLLVLGVPPVAVGVAGGGLSLGLAIVVSLMSGELYARFNPSE